MKVFDSLLQGILIIIDIAFVFFAIGVFVSITAYLSDPKRAVMCMISHKKGDVFLGNSVNNFDGRLMIYNDYETKCLRCGINFGFKSVRAN